MQQTGGDGLSVNYSPYSRKPESGEYCATQTGGNSFNYNFGGAPFAASPGSKVTSTSGGLVLTPASEQPRLGSSSEVSPVQFQDDLFPQIQNFSPSAFAVSSNRVLPTPPPTNTYEAQAQHGLKNLNSSVLPMSSFTSGLDHPSSSSQDDLGTRQWQPSHPEPLDNLDFTQPGWPIIDQPQSQNLAQNLAQNSSQGFDRGMGMMPSAPAGRFSPPMGTPAYGTPSFNQHNQMDHGEEIAMPDFGAQSPLQPMQQQHVSPQQDGEGLGSFQFGGGEIEDAAMHAPAEQAEQSDKNDGDKAEEHQPYAQLIWKALMSRPDHSMTLQEIYQWFRDNTEKAKGEGKGWQNSIRHNLSMNHAFTKVDRQANPEDASSSSNPQEAKKSSTWVLEDWAVDGVQSTTRYRKGNPSRRGGAPGTSVAEQRRHENIVARATSGRRGIVTPNHARPAVARRPAPSRAQHAELFGAQSSSYMAADYNRPYSFPQLQATEAMFPPLPARNMNDLGPLFPQNLPSGLPVASLQTANSGQEYTYTTQQGQGMTGYANRGYQPDAYTLTGPAAPAGAYTVQRQPHPARHSHEMPLVAPGYGESFTHNDYTGYDEMEQQQYHH